MNKNQTICIENSKELKNLCTVYKESNDRFYSFEEIKEALREVTEENGRGNYGIDVGPEELLRRYYMFENVEYKEYPGDGFFALYRYVDIAKG